MSSAVDTRPELIQEPVTLSEPLLEMSIVILIGEALQECDMNLTLRYNSCVDCGLGFDIRIFDANDHEHSIAVRPASVDTCVQCPDRSKDDKHDCHLHKFVPYEKLILVSHSTEDAVKSAKEAVKRIAELIDQIQRR
jgi:hypothetical protein